MTMTKEEALKYIHNMWMTQETHDALEVLIPEFGMSNDERIRKAIIDGMKFLQKQGKTLFHNVPMNDVISYLERQKEQKDFQAKVE